MQAPKEKKKERKKEKKRKKRPSDGLRLIDLLEVPE
jgi:hypothetical protein